MPAHTISLQHNRPCRSGFQEATSRATKTHRMRCMNWYSSSALVAVSPLRLLCMSLAISATVSCTVYRSVFGTGEREGQREVLVHSVCTSG